MFGRLSSFSKVVRGESFPDFLLRDRLGVSGGEMVEVTDLFSILLVLAFKGIAQVAIFQEEMENWNNSNWKGRFVEPRQADRID